jgi:hypothetical protein
MFDRSSYRKIKVRKRGVSFVAGTYFIINDTLSSTRCARNDARIY